MLIILCILTSILVFSFIFGPFFFGRGGSLFAHSALASEESLALMQASLLTNYLKCEEQFEKEQIRQREWEQRQNFLTNRYLDVTRRLDTLRLEKKEHSHGK
jgi:hypothetical protein